MTKAHKISPFRCISNSYQPSKPYTLNTNTFSTSSSQFFCTKRRKSRKRCSATFRPTQHSTKSTAKKPRNLSCVSQANSTSCMTGASSDHYTQKILSSPKVFLHSAQLRPSTPLLAAHFGWRQFCWLPHTRDAISLCVSSFYSSFVVGWCWVCWERERCSSLEVVSGCWGVFRELMKQRRCVLVAEEVSRFEVARGSWVFWREVESLLGLGTDRKQFRNNF